MGGELVNSLLPDEGDGDKKAVSLISYREIFEKHFPYYLSIGMTYDEYWNGDNQLVKAYREADKLRIQRKNHELWLQGAYVYEALCDVAPILNAMSRRNKPAPYPKHPFNSQEEEKPKSKIEQEKAKFESDKKKFELMMRRVNAKFAREAKRGEDNGG